MGGISLSGYVVESVRIGSANGPYTTPQPDTTIDPVPFSLYFTDDEPVPTHEYAVFCREGGKLQEATFQWTKNDTIKRFGYSSSARTFKPLPGSAPVVLGDLSVDSNTERLIGGALISTDTVTYPIRISLSSGSVTIPSTVVLSFSVPPAPGTVNVRLSDGALDWAPDLISSYEGDSVSFQGQTFLEEPTATGNLGVISQNLYLNPIPSVGSFPILRIGFRFPLTALPVPDEASFPGSIPSGTVYYATDTGRLAFSATDLATYEGVSVYYDGTHVTGGFPVTLPAFGVGNVVGLFSSATLSPLPPEGGDILITLSFGGDTHTVPNTVRVTVHSGSVPDNTVEIDPSGLLKFSSTDANNYSGWAITATVADLPLEHGVSVRFFRSLADPSQANPEIPDVTSVYTVENQKWAEPIQGVPFFFLPVIPLEDSSYPTIISVLAGSGSYLTSDFPRLDRNPPPLTEGYGYILSEDDSRFYFGYRSVNRILSPVSESTFALDPTVQKKGLLLEEETFPGSGVFVPILEGADFSLDPLSGTGTATSPVGPVVASGFSGSLDGITGVFTDPSADFTGIPPGADLILNGNSAAYRVGSVLNPNQILLSGIGPFFNSKGSYKIHTSPEILANRVWMPVDTADPNLSLTRERNLGSATNNPRLSVAPSEVTRFSVTLDEVPATSLSLVSSFTDPSSLPSGTVEVNGSSGLLNFSTGDLGKSVKAIITERPSLDFTVNPTLGFFEVNTRFFEGERATLSYRRADNLESVTEAVRFLRRKVPVSHPVQTSTFEIPSGNQTFTNTPSPRIFRSGRPLTEGVDYTLNGKTVTLLPSNQVTKAFPSGPIAPEESVLVDFYVIDALGGEKTFSSVISPIYSPPVTLTAGSLTFKTLTDLTGSLPPQTFLRFDKTEIAEVVTVSWDGSASTITVSSTIREDRTNPTIERITPLTVSVDPYRPELVPVLTPASPSPLGSNTIKFPGDVSSTFRTGCILRIGSTRPYLVGGSSFNKETNTTTVTLTTTLYDSVSQSTTMVVSSCPVVESGGPFTVTLNRVPVSTVTVVREGQSGSTVTVEGQSTLTFPPLQEGETLFATYTAARVFDPGIQLRFTGNSLVVPDTQTNGLLGQFLRASFSVYQPDSFYTRVVPIEKVFRGEVATELQPTNGGGGSGPTTENASGTPVLKDSGVPSLFWEERHWTNADLAAKSYLLYYHKLCDALDRVLERVSGIVPGLTDGPFRYDGAISIASSVRAATNQIDDLIPIAPNKTVPAYLAGATSRFFPSFRFKSRLSGSTTTDGEVILSTEETSVQAISLFRARLSRALVVETAALGDTVINLTSTNPPDSPPFQSGMAVVVQNPDGSFVVPPSSPLIILTVFPTFLSVTVPLLVEIPEGSTLYRSPLDTSGATPDLTAFQEGRDYDVDFEGGNILYKNPIPPYDGSDPAVPVSLLAKPIPSTTHLDFGVTVPYPFNAPDAIPALHGTPQTDDGEIETLPMVSPSFQCEWNSLSRGFLATEADLLADLLSTTEDLHEYTVSVDGTGFVITNSGPSWPAPAPVPGDLLKVLTGANTGDSFYPIISVGVSDLNLGFALPVPGETGISVAITVDSQTPSTGDILAGGTTLEDLTAPFVASDVGKPLIILSGPDAGQRRQIESVTAATTASFSAPLTVTVGISYRVGQSIATFGSVSGGLFGDIADILLSSLQPLYTNIITDMEDFLDTLTVEQATGTTGSVSAVPDTFSDLSADFSALSLPLFLEISSGPNEGLYPIDSFLSPTSLQIGNGGSSPTFSTLEGGVSYRVVQIPTSSATFAVSMTQKKQEIEDLIGQITSFFSLFSGVTVETLPLAYANKLRDAFVTARIAQNIARRSVSDAYASDFKPFLTSSPNAYGLRYAWISARIHRITGFLSRVARAITNRKETVAQQIAGFLLAQS